MLCNLKLKLENLNVISEIEMLLLMPLLATSIRPLTQSTHYHPLLSASVNHSEDHISLICLSMSMNLHTFRLLFNKDEDIKRLTIIAGNRS